MNVFVKYKKYARVFFGREGKNTKKGNNKFTIKTCVILILCTIVITHASLAYQTIIVPIPTSKWLFEQQKNYVMSMVGQEEGKIVVPSGCSMSLSEVYVLDRWSDGPSPYFNIKNRVYTSGTHVVNSSDKRNSSFFGVIFKDDKSFLDCPNGYPGDNVIKSIFQAVGSSTSGAPLDDLPKTKRETKPINIKVIDTADIGVKTSGEINVAYGFEASKLIEIGPQTGEIPIYRRGDNLTAFVHWDATKATISWDWTIMPPPPGSYNGNIIVTARLK